MFFNNDLPVSPLQHRLLTDNLELEIGEKEKGYGYCVETKKTFDGCCSSVVTQRITGVTFTALAAVSIYYKVYNNYTEGVYDKSLGRYTEGRYISATVLSAGIGGFSAAAFHFFAQSSCSRLHLYQIDALLLMTLPFLFYLFNQEELNDVKDDLTIKDAAFYEKMFTCIFSVGMAMIVTDVAANLRKPGEDERWDLTNMSDFHNPWMGKKVRHLLGTANTFGDFIGWECLIPFFVGIGCFGMGSLSNLDQYKFVHFKVGDETDGGQAYLCNLAGLYLTAAPTARALFYLLIRSIKKHQKWVLENPQAKAASRAQGARLLAKDFAGYTSGFAWTALFQLGYNNPVARFFTFFFLVLEADGYDKLRFISGGEPASSVVPTRSEEVTEMMKIFATPRSMGCGRFRVSLRIPTRSLELKGWYYRNCEKMIMVLGASLVTAQTIWLGINTIEAADDWKNQNGSGVKMISALTSTVTLPIWYASKHWIDHTHIPDTDELRNTVRVKMKNSFKFLVSHNPAKLMLIGLLINQIYGRISSHAENQEGSPWDYFWNVIASIFLNAPYALTAASLNKLNKSVAIIYVLAAMQKISKGDH